MADGDINDPEKRPEVEQSTSEGQPAESCTQPCNQVTIPEVELEHLKVELNDYKDKYLRSLADSENARKRLQKERQELIQYALQNVMTDFLNPIDHMENALKFTQQTSEEVKHWAVGFTMILNQFKDVLSNHGVFSFDSAGTQFDPHCHEAVEMISTADYQPGTIVSESLKGYKMGNRTIRPARVTVAKTPSPSESPNEMKEEQKNN